MNLGPDVEGLVPADGVYAAGWSASRCRTTRSTGCSRAPCRSGRTPPSTAARPGRGYVLDRTDLDLYGERVCYELVRRLRPT